MRETVTPVPVTLRGESAGAGPALAPGELHFSVRYALPEYVSFMWQHAAFLIRRRRVGRLTGLWLLSRSTAAAAMHFVAQRRASRVYEFSVDDHGIIRVCGTGVTLVPWTDVSAIRRYSCGYIVVLKRGTLPIPLRCLTAGQTRSMDAYAAGVKAARR
ncbi:MAG TPA: YcxB family protein [Telluria sp.]